MNLVDGFRAFLVSAVRRDYQGVGKGTASGRAKAQMKSHAGNRHQLSP